jgi:hypothetical protein
MYEEKWKRGMTLAIIISHQIHHRAQLTVVMRLNGLKVPGVFLVLQKKNGLIMECLNKNEVTSKRMILYYPE